MIEGSEVLVPLSKRFNLFHVQTFEDFYDQYILKYPSGLDVGKCKANGWPVLDCWTAFVGNSSLDQIIEMMDLKGTENDEKNVEFVLRSGVRAERRDVVLATLTMLGYPRGYPDEKLENLVMMIDDSSRESNIFFDALKEIGYDNFPFYNTNRMIRQNDERTKELLKWRLGRLIALNQLFPGEIMNLNHEQKIKYIIDAASALTEDDIDNSKEIYGLDPNLLLDRQGV